MKRLLLAGLACVALAGCSTFHLQSPISFSAPPAPKTPAQTVYLIEAGYVAALKIEVAYAKLPPCFPGGPVLCSNAVTLGKIRQADTTTHAAIITAETAVRGAAGDVNMVSAIAVAQADLLLLTGLTSSVRTH